MEGSILGFLILAQAILKYMILLENKLVMNQVVMSKISVVNNMDLIKIQ